MTLSTFGNTDGSQPSGPSCMCLRYDSPCGLNGRLGFLCSIAFHMIKSLALSALIAVSAFGSAAMARPQYGHCGTFDDGADFCWTPIGTRSVELIINDKFDSTGYIGVMDCSNGKIRVRANDGYSTNTIRNQLNIVCDM